ncbi:MAG: aldo/keto reductase [Magnetovibrionaceae bacterium]
MERVRLGRTGIPVSKLCFGTMTFGGAADAETSAEIYGACRDAGVTFFDCADMYNGGEAERILGRLIAHERDEIVLTSKCVMPVTKDVDPANRGANRRHILNAVEASLKRLGTDRLDVLFIHQWDPETPMEQTLRAVDDLVRSGKVVYAGVSNWAAWAMAKALGIQAREGWQAFDIIQPMYSLLKRQVEVEILPFAASEDLAVICYSPGAGGLLSGKYSGIDAEKGTRLGDSAHYRRRYSVDWYWDTIQNFGALAKEWGHHPMSLAIAWAGAQEAITCPIIGARNMDQLKTGLAAAEIALSPDQRAEITALSQTPPPATDRLDDVI